jgi:hypothetical protein
MFSVIAPIIFDETRISVGYIPFDVRSGKQAMIFNRKIGLLESRKFLGVSIPQFAPGFNAARTDVFFPLFSKLKETHCAFKSRMGKEMVAIDFAYLALAARMGEKSAVAKLTPIEGTFIKRPSRKKLAAYLEHHKTTVSFLEKP